MLIIIITWCNESRWPCQGWENLLRFWAIAEKDPFEGAWKNRWLWIRSGGAIIDLLAILPAYINFFVHLDLRYLRILRLFRLLKLTRYFVSLQILLRVIKREKGSFQAVIFILLIMIIIAAAGVYVVENKHNRKSLAPSLRPCGGRWWRWPQSAMAMWHQSPP